MELIRTPIIIGGSSVWMGRAIAQRKFVRQIELQRGMLASEEETWMGLEIRNPGGPLDLQSIHDIRVNRGAIEQRAATLPGRRSVKGEHQIAWMFQAIRCIDLTTLAGDDTDERARRLAQKAIRRVRKDLLEAYGIEPNYLHCASVCTYHDRVAIVESQVKGSGVGVCAVSTGFPAGQIPLDEKLRQIHASVEAGATEIDIVVTRPHILAGKWPQLYEEVRAYRGACGEAHLKTILATGDLATLKQVAQASRVCMLAGADFIKTSTGKESVNATIPVGLVMLREIRNHLKMTGAKVGFKAAGGIGKAKQAVLWLALMKDELGDDWMQPELFRIGASSLLGDLERQIEFHLTGRYSAARRHAMA